MGPWGKKSTKNQIAEAAENLILFDTSTSVLLKLTILCFKRPVKKWLKIFENLFFTFKFRRLFSVTR